MKLTVTGAELEAIIKNHIKEELGLTIAALEVVTDGEKFAFSEVVGTTVQAEVTK